MRNPLVFVALIHALLLQGCGDGAEQPSVAQPSATASAALQVEAPSADEGWYTTIADPKSAAQVHKSPADDRDYRYLKLDNGLEILLVSDPEADKAAASLSIDVGSFENPADREGLAHFLEHMLFLGTDKYPEPGEYQSFLSEHGGTFNAYTSLEETNYFFEVDATYLAQTLDRFSRFFVAPLFNEEYVDRERHAVDSEYQLKIKDDYRREWDVLRELANPEHPFSKFSVGNLDTLNNSKDDPVREDLLGFYQQFYSASRMNLVVLGRESVDELEAAVRQRFAEVPSHDVALPEQYTPLFQQPLPMKVAIRPEKEMRSLNFAFPVPSLSRDWRLKPAEYLGHLLGHEGEGSLLSVLKAQGLAEGLVSGLEFDSRHGALFSVRIQLTPEGLAQEKRVTQYFFQWLELIKSQGLEAWRYDEVARMSELEFRYAEKAPAMGYVSSLSTALHVYTPEDILRGGSLYAGFDGKRMAELASHLHPDNVAVVLVAPEVVTDRVNKLYGARYGVSPLAVADLQASAAQNLFHLPAKNPYIPDNLQLVSIGQRAAPQSLADKADAWLAPHNPFNTPKAFFEARIAMPSFDTLEEVTAGEFALALVMDQLSAEVYPAMLAGLDFSLTPWDNGYRIRIHGYSDKQPVLLDRILDVLHNPDWNEARINRVKATLVRQWRNTAKDWPLRQLFGRFPTLVKQTWLPAEKADQLEKLTREQVVALHGQMIKGGSGRFYGAGNLSADSLNGLIATVSDKLALAPGEAPPVAVRNLKRSDELFASDYYVDHGDSAALLYLQGDADNLRERATFALLDVMASAPFYSTLRTEKQLGYAVGSSIAPVERVPGLMYYVQSPKVDADGLQREITLFFKEFAAKVDAMTAEDLERYRQSVLARLEEKPKNLRELAQRHLESLDLGYRDFDFREQLASELRAITLDELKAAYQRVVMGEKAGFWVLTTTDKAVGDGEDIPEAALEQAFSYQF